MAGQEPQAFSLDLLMRPINVSWGGGLAVEFGDKAEDAPGMEAPVVQRTTRRRTGRQ